MKVLLIEDNIYLAKSISRYLQKEFVVETAYTGTEGKERALRLSYAVILLDLTLPDISGHDICKNLRDTGITTPIIITSADHTVDSRVKLLECGADDFIVKPFRADELVARIHAVLRRNMQRADYKIAVGDLILDTHSRRVYKGEEYIPLRRKEFDVLEYLANNKGRAISRMTVLNHVWSDSKDSWQNTVDVHIMHLRDKIDRPYKTTYIKTVYGVGYMVDDAKE